MTIKYSVSGAKARNGKEILPMAFGDRAEAERFAKYHEGLSVPQNLREHPGNITVVGTGSMQYPQLQNIPKSSESATAQAVLSALIKSGDEFVMNSLHGQQFGRIRRRNFEEGGVERKSPPVTFVVDPKVLTVGVEEPTRPVQVLKLPKENVHDGKDALPGCSCEVCLRWRKSPANQLDDDDESDADKYAACEDAMKVNDNMRRYGAIDVPRSATVDNADLEMAYAMGFRAAFYGTGNTLEGAMESQDYVDQRRSDLKELVSYDRSK